MSKASEESSHASLHSCSQQASGYELNSTLRPSLRVWFVCREEPLLDVDVIPGAVTKLKLSLTALKLSLTVWEYDAAGYVLFWALSVNETK